MFRSSRSVSSPRHDAGQRGFTVVLVLAAGSLLTLLALLFVEYGRWGKNLRKANWHLYQQHQALRLARRQTRVELEATLEDTGYLAEPVQQHWELEPDMTVRARSVSLNGRFNLNLLNRPGVSGTYRELLESVLARLGYPQRTGGELIRWIEPSGDLGAPGVDRYGGYPYDAPGRPFHHLDELALVSGFIQRGIQPPLRRLLTVHGSGNINVHHLTPSAWQMIASVGGERIPSVPPSALQNQEALTEYLTRESRWQRLQGHFAFLSRRDDAIRTRYTLRSGGNTLRVEAVYERRGDDARLSPVTRYVLNDPPGPHPQDAGSPL